MIVDEVALRTLIEEAVRKVVREELHGRLAEAGEYVSVAEAARRIDVAPATIREWIGQGKLGRYHAGRELRVKIAELEASLTVPFERDGVSPEEEARRFLEHRVRASSRR